MNKADSDYQDYKKIKLLGKGTHSQAFLVESVIDGALCVIREVKLTDVGKLTLNMLASTLKRYKALESLKHSNIIKFRQIFLTGKDTICIVMHFANDKSELLSSSFGDSLRVKIKDRMGKHLTENQILDWFTQICLAVKYLHEKKVAFLDLTIDSIFLTSKNVIKLGDIALSEVFSNIEEKTGPNFTTSSYSSPTSLITDSIGSLEGNIKALGVILYQLCALKAAVEEEAHVATPDIPDIYSAKLKNLVETLLNYEALNGLGIDSILENCVRKPKVRNFFSINTEIQRSSLIQVFKKRPKDIYEIAQIEQLKKIKKIKIRDGLQKRLLVVKCLRSNQLYVIQEILQIGRSRTDCESRAFKFLDHPYLTKHRRFYLGEDDNIYQVVEYVHGNSLKAKIKSQNGKPFYEEQILEWLTQICLALKYLHDRKVAHRGLKIIDIYLGTNNTIKLKDLASVEIEIQNDNNPYSFGYSRGVFPYDFSVDNLKGQPYDQTSDMWALGIVLYELCTLEYPFKADGIPFILKKMLEEEYAPIPPFISKDLINLTQSLLCANSSERPTIDDVLNNHIVQPRVQKYLQKQGIKFPKLLHNEDLATEHINQD